MPPRTSQPEIDVLFYGSVNERRRIILQELLARGVRLQTLFGVYGQERDTWIARSRTVLNLHAHEGQILELPRLAYLWANKVPVVAEVNDETEDSLGMSEAMVTAGYDELVDRVCGLVAAPAEAERAAVRCYETFRTGPTMTQVVRAGFMEAAHV